MGGDGEQAGTRLYENIVRGKPEPQQRHRETVGFGGKKEFEDPSVQEKQDFAIQFTKKPGKPSKEDVRMEIIYAFKIPDHVPKKDRKAWIHKSHTSVPDKDSLDKFVMDALKGTFYVDDCQVWDSRSFKVYSEVEGTIVRVWL